MIRHSRKHHIDSTFVYALAVLAILALSNVQRFVFNVKSKTEVSLQEIKSQQIFDSVIFSDVKIKGKAFVVYDIVNKKVIAEKNSSQRLPIASITKIMTTITARSYYDGKKVITIKDSSIDGGYDLGLKKGQSFSLNELLKYTLVFSSNDGAQAIADELGGRKAFVQQMNVDAKNLGLDLTFTHPAGLDENGKFGGEGTALSVAKLAAIARKDFPEMFDATIKTRATVVSSLGKISGVPNTNQKVDTLSGLELSKTGFTDDAGGNLVVIVDIVLGHPVAIVVLGSTREERFSDVDNLYKTLQKSITSK